MAVVSWRPSNGDRKRCYPAASVAATILPWRPEGLRHRQVHPAGLTATKKCGRAFGLAVGITFADS